MLDQSMRAEILKLHEQGHSIRGIARAMELSRGAVRHVLRSATDQVPQLERPEKATPYREQILELYPLNAAELSTSEDPLKDDEDAQKVLACGQFLAQMFASGTLKDDPICR